VTVQSARGGSNWSLGRERQERVAIAWERGGKALTLALHLIIGNSPYLAPLGGKQSFPEENLKELPMDFKTLLTTFGLIFLAELGDKTQFAALCLSADNQSRLSVFLGASLALVTSALLAVLLGAVLARCFPPYIIKTVAGILFVVMGVVMLISR